MITKRIIPCLDIRDGRVVKGVNFENVKSVEDPVALAQFYNESGADELVFYDITASVEKRPLFTDVLTRVAQRIFIPLTVGGSINSVADFDRVLKAGINNETYKYYIWFASQHGIEYVILDEGWAVNKQADLMQVVPEIDLEELVEYGRERNVGIILWAGYYAFERDMERVVKHYADMGVKGFKVDFMDRDDQRMVDFLHRAAEVCAEHKMLLDFHGVFKPTGLNRTWPNVLNYEGVFGLEQLKWSAESTDMVKYDVTMPFIRMVAGPMDYTQGAMRNASRGNYRPVHSEPMSQGTRCRQLAEYVVFESPITMLCDSPSNYMKEPECFAFMASVPTVWDETVALTGSVGEYIAIARRSGDTWYIGAMTDWTPRELELDLSFIGNGNYDIESFADGINADRAARDFRKTVSELPQDRRLKIRMAPGGGYAARIYAR